MHLRIELRIRPAFESESRIVLEARLAHVGDTARLIWALEGYGGSSGERAVDADFARQVAGEIRKLPTLPRGQPALGLDGVSYELQVHHDSGRALFSWWMRPPEGWEGLSQVVSLLHDAAGGGPGEGAAASRRPAHLGPESTRPTGDGPTRVIAVDWSGAKQGAHRSMWLAEVKGSRLVRLEAGRTRPEMSRHLVEECERDPRLVVGLDFAFSLPAWFLEERGLEGAPDLWELVRGEGEAWLDGCEPPFWGRPGKKRPELPEHFRATDGEIEAVGGITPKSPFQIGGAGAVGTGSIRGMQVLADLREAGYRVWPFDSPELPLVIEIYPRILTGSVNKSSPTERAGYVERQFPDVAARFTEAIAASEDAFDAAVSALVMARHRESFGSLPAARTEAERLEGRIWVPSPAG